MPLLNWLTFILWQLLSTGKFKGRFVEGLPSGQGTWTMEALPGAPTVAGEQVIIQGQWQGLRPAPIPPGADDNVYTLKRVDMVRSIFPLSIPASDSGG